MNDGVLAPDSGLRDLFSLNYSRTLNDVLCNNVSCANEMKRRLEAINVHAYYSYPTLGLFELDSGEDNYRTRCNAAEELYAVMKRHAPRHCAILLDDLSHFAVIFSWDDRESIVRLYKNMGNLHFNNRIHMLTLGISNPHQHLTDLHTCYEQALFAVKHRFYQDTSQAIYYNGINEYAKDAEYPEDKEDELLYILIGEHTTTTAEQAVDAFFEALLRNGPLPRNKVNDATLQLLFSLQLRVKSVLGHMYACPKLDIMSLIQLQTLQDIKSSVCHMVNQLSATAYTSERFNRAIIKKAVAYMEEEFDKVSLHYVAEKLFITPAYLSSLFKSKMGVTFIDHLTHIRMTNAKKLLRQTHMKNYEVAEKVGYQDSRYFSQIFKKKVGLSPSEFRDAN